MEGFSGKKSRELASRQKKDHTENNGSKQNKKRGNRKVESNDNPEIPDRGETSDIPGLPSGTLTNDQTVTQKQKVALHLSRLGPW